MWVAVFSILVRLNTVCRRLAFPTTSGHVLGRVNAVNEARVPDVTAVAKCIKSREVLFTTTAV